jgi:phage terminase large subunit-like protein
MTNDNTSVAFMSEDNGVVLAESFAFIPEGRIDEKNAFEKIDYRQFIRQGHVIACGDLTIDYSVVEQFVFDLEERFGVHIVAIGFDRYNAMSSAQKWDQKYTTVEVKQHSSVLHPATKLLYEQIMDGHFQNARCTFDTNLNRYVNKKKSNGKVDMVVSLINAIYLLQQDRLMNYGGFVAQVI